MKLKVKTTIDRNAICMMRVEITVVPSSSADEINVIECIDIGTLYECFITTRNCHGVASNIRSDSLCVRDVFIVKAPSEVDHWHRNNATWTIKNEVNT